MSDAPEPARGLAADLAAWAAAAAVDEAARQRAAAHWARQAQASDATMVGVLVDLAEHGGRVSVATASGRVHHGTVVSVGPDLVALVADGGARVIVALHAVTRVDGERGALEPGGDRVAPLEVSFADVLTGLAAERERARIGVIGLAELVVGELRAVGDDVVTVRTDAGRAQHVARGRIADLTIG